MKEREGEGVEGEGADEVGGGGGDCWGILSTICEFVNS